ncbi:hypothetical protein ACBZ90_00985 (plasmid) [Vibrio alginolyticus]
MKSTTFMHLAVLMITSPVALAGGTLGGSPSADSGAVNAQNGKCVTYAQAVKEAKQQGEDPSDIAIPKGCQAKS